MGFRVRIRGSGLSWAQCVFGSGALGFRPASCWFFVGNRELSTSSSKLGWKVRPKQHQLEHLALDFVRTNPRYDCNYLGEDMIRRTKQLLVPPGTCQRARSVEMYSTSCSSLP